MTTYEIEKRTVTETPTAVCTAKLTAADMPALMPRTFWTVAGVLGAQGAVPSGPPFARYRMLGDGVFETEAGFPASRPVEPSDDVQPSTLPGGPVAYTVHVGPYDVMRPAYDAIEAWMRANGVEPNGDMWEVYLSDPVAEPDPATWRTEIYAPFRRA